MVKSPLWGGGQLLNLLHPLLMQKEKRKIIFQLARSKTISVNLGRFQLREQEKEKQRTSWPRQAAGLRAAPAGCAVAPPLSPPPPPPRPPRAAGPCGRGALG